MGLFNFSTKSIDELQIGIFEERERSARRGREQRVLRVAAEKKRKIEGREKLRRQQEVQRTGEQVGKGLAAFAKEGQQRPTFSQEQQALQSMFGHGEHIWGTPDSENRVTIHNDLNPRQRGDFGTAELFGF